VNRPRLLPWSEDGKRAYLYSSDPNSALSRLADQMEEAQLSVGGDVLVGAKEVMSDPKAPVAELRFTASRLAECLVDALRVAESRGARLADAEDKEDEPFGDDEEAR